MADDLAQESLELYDPTSKLIPYTFNSYTDAVLNKVTPYQPPQYINLRRDPLYDLAKTRAYSPEQEKILDDASKDIFAVMQSYSGLEATFATNSIMAATLGISYEEAARNHDSYMLMFTGKKIDDKTFLEALGDAWESEKVNRELSSLMHKYDRAKDESERTRILDQIALQERKAAQLYDYNNRNFFQEQAINTAPLLRQQVRTLEIALGTTAAVALLSATGQIAAGGAVGAAGIKTIIGSSFAAAFTGSGATGTVANAARGIAMFADTYQREAGSFSYELYNMTDEYGNRVPDEYRVAAKTLYGLFAAAVEIGTFEPMYNSFVKGAFGKAAIGDSIKDRFFKSGVRGFAFNLVRGAHGESTEEFFQQIGSDIAMDVAKRISNANGFTSFQEQSLATSLKNAFADGIEAYKQAFIPSLALGLLDVDNYRSNFGSREEISATATGYYNPNSREGLSDQAGKIYRSFEEETDTAKLWTEASKRQERREGAEAIDASRFNVDRNHITDRDYGLDAKGNKAAKLEPINVVPSAAYENEWVGATEEDNDKLRYLIDLGAKAIAVYKKEVSDTKATPMSPGNFSNAVRSAGGYIASGDIVFRSVEDADRFFESASKSVQRNGDGTITVNINGKERTYQVLINDESQAQTATAEQQSAQAEQAEAIEQLEGEEEDTNSLELSEEEEAQLASINGTEEAQGAPFASEEESPAGEPIETLEQAEEVNTPEEAATEATESQEQTAAEQEEEAATEAATEATKEAEKQEAPAEAEAKSEEVKTEPKKAKKKAKEKKKAGVKIKKTEEGLKIFKQLKEEVDPFNVDDDFLRTFAEALALIGKKYPGFKPEKWIENRGTIINKMLRATHETGGLPFGYFNGENHRFGFANFAHSLTFMHELWHALWAADKENRAAVVAALKEVLADKKQTEKLRAAIQALENKQADVTLRQESEGQAEEKVRLSVLVYSESADELIEKLRTITDPENVSDEQEEALNDLNAVYIAESQSITEDGENSRSLPTKLGEIFAKMARTVRSIIGELTGEPSLPDAIERAYNGFYVFDEDGTNTNLQDILYTPSAEELAEQQALQEERKRLAQLAEEPDEQEAEQTEISAKEQAERQAKIDKAKPILKSLGIDDAAIEGILVDVFPPDEDYYNPSPEELFLNDVMNAIFETDPLLDKYDPPGSNFSVEDLADIVPKANAALEALGVPTNIGRLTQDIVSRVIDNGLTGYFDSASTLLDFVELLDNYQNGEATYGEVADFLYDHASEEANEIDLLNNDVPDALGERERTLYDNIDDAMSDLFDEAIDEEEDLTDAVESEVSRIFVAHLACDYTENALAKLGVSTNAQSVKLIGEVARAIGVNYSDAEKLIDNLYDGAKAPAISEIKEEISDRLEYEIDEDIAKKEISRLARLAQNAFKADAKKQKSQKTKTDSGMRFMAFERKSDEDLLNDVKAGKGLRVSETRTISNAEISEILSRPNMSIVHAGEQPGVMVLERTTGASKGEIVEKIKASAPVIAEPTSDRDSVKKYLETKLGAYVNKDTGYVYQLYGSGIDEAIQHNKFESDKIGALKAIPELIENSIYVGTEQSAKEKSTGKSYEYYVAGLEIDGEKYTARLVMRMDPNDSRKKYYDQRLSRIEKGELLSQTTLVPNQGGESELSSKGKDNKLFAIAQDLIGENNFASQLPGAVNEAKSAGSETRFFAVKPEKVETLDTKSVESLIDHGVFVPSTILQNHLSSSVVQEELDMRDAIDLLVTEEDRKLMAKYKKVESFMKAIKKAREGAGDVWSDDMDIMYRTAFAYSKTLKPSEMRKDFVDRYSTKKGVLKLKDLLGSKEYATEDGTMLWLPKMDDNLKKLFSLNKDSSDEKVAEVIYDIERNTDSWLETYYNTMLDYETTANNGYNPSSYPEGDAAALTYLSLSDAEFKYVETLRRAGATETQEEADYNSFIKEQEDSRLKVENSYYTLLGAIKNKEDRKALQEAHNLLSSNDQEEQRQGIVQINKLVGAYQEIIDLLNEDAKANAKLIKKLQNRIDRMKLMRKLANRTRAINNYIKKTINFSTANTDASFFEIANYMYNLMRDTGKDTPFAPYTIADNKYDDARLRKGQIDEESGKSYIFTTLQGTEVDEDGLQNEIYVDIADSMDAGDVVMDVDLGMVQYDRKKIPAELERWLPIEAIVEIENAEKSWRRLSIETKEALATALFFAKQDAKTALQERKQVDRNRRRKLSNESQNSLYKHDFTIGDEDEVRARAKRLGVTYVGTDEYGRKEFLRLLESKERAQLGAEIVDNRSAIRTKLDNFKSWFMKFQRITEMLDGKKGGALTRIFVDAPQKALDALARNKTRRRQALENSIKKMYTDDKNVRKEREAWMNNAHDLDGSFFTGDHDGLKLTGAEIVGAYMYSKNVFGFIKLISEQGNHLALEDIARINPTALLRYLEYDIFQLHRDPNARTITGINDRDYLEDVKNDIEAGNYDSIIPEWAKTFGDELIGQLDEESDRLESTAYREYNTIFKKQENYVPLYSKNGGSRDISIQQSKNGTERVFRGMLFDRKAVRDYALELNPIKVMVRAIDEQEMFINMTGVVNDMNYIMDNGGLSETLRNKYGDGYVKLFRDQIEVLAGNRKDLSEFEKGYNKILGSAAVGILGWNLSSTSKQFLSLVTSLAQGEFSVAELATGIIEYMQDREGGTELFRRLAPDLADSAPTIELKMLKDSNAFKKYSSRFGERFMSQLTDKSMAWVSMADQWTKKAVWLTAFKKNLASGMDESQAALKATQLVKRTQSVYSAESLSQIERMNSPFARSAFMFTKDLFQAWNIITGDIPLDIKNKNIKGAAEKALGIVAVGGLLAALKFNWVPDKDDDDDENEFLGDFLNQMVEYAVPVGGNYIAPIIRGGYVSNDGLVESAFSAVVSSARKGIKGDDAGDVIEQFFSAALSASSLIGVPSTAIQRVGKSIFSEGLSEGVNINPGYLYNSGLGKSEQLRIGE